MREHTLHEVMQDSLDRSPVGFPPPTNKKQTRKLKLTQIITHAVRKM